MNRGLVNLDELRKNIDRADFYGSTAYCFVLGDKIIKVYARRRDKGNFFPINPWEVIDLSKYQADTIVFPNEYIYEDNKKAGEILNYINNLDITYSFNDEANVESIISGYDTVIQDLHTYNNILMNDLCSVNILFSNELGFHIIDTTKWSMDNDALKKNIKMFNYALISVIRDNLEIPLTFSKYYNHVDELFYNNMAKYGEAGKKLQESFKLIMNNRYNIIRLMYALMDGYRIYSGKDAKTLKDTKEFVKVLKNG